MHKQIGRIPLQNAHDVLAGFPRNQIMRATQGNTARKRAFWRFAVFGDSTKKAAAHNTNRVPTDSDGSLQTWPKIVSNCLTQASIPISNRKSSAPTRISMGYGRARETPHKADRKARATTANTTDACIHTSTLETHTHTRALRSPSSSMKPYRSVISYVM